MLPTPASAGRRYRPRRIPLFAVIGGAIFVIFTLSQTIHNPYNFRLSQPSTESPPQAAENHDTTRPPPLEEIIADGNAKSDDTILPQDQIDQIGEAERLLWKSRAADVRESFLHAWTSYEKVAWGADEIQPISMHPVQNFNGWGVSIVDALDTLLIMDLRDEFKKAMQHVEKISFHQAEKDAAAFFETIIRYLGGFLSAHSLLKDDNMYSNIPWMPESKDTRQKYAELLLKKADDLGTRLMPAFNTSSGLPKWGVNTVSGTLRGGLTSLLAEVASYQMEFKYLAHLTGKKHYFDVADNAINILQKTQKEQLRSASPMGGMLPTSFNVESGMGADSYMSIGSLADSAYEYFLKGYLLSNRSEPRLLEMYLASMKTAIEELVYVSPIRSMTYITDARNNHRSHRLEHLSCFFPGLLTLGLENLKMDNELPEEVKTRHGYAAKGILESCYLLYADTPTGLSAEEVQFNRNSQLWIDTYNAWERQTKDRSDLPLGVHEDKDLEKLAFVYEGKPKEIGEIAGVKDKEYRPNRPDWRMRPETIESLFLMHRYTSLPIWRERCYSIYQGMERSSRINSGYANVRDAAQLYTLDEKDEDYETKKSRYLDNEMPSYSLAETFKYLYLCMLDPDEVKKMLPADKWVFNTEAHPLPVFEWDEEARKGWLKG